MKNNKNNDNNKLTKIVTSVFALLCVFVLVVQFSGTESYSAPSSKQLGSGNLLEMLINNFMGNDETPEPTLDKVSDELKIHYIDVGQAESTLITVGDRTMLIDAGEFDSADYLISYVKNQGISRLNYIVATHPHADHIGAMAKVIESFDVDNFILPDVTHTTKTFEKMILAAQTKKLKLTVPEIDDTFSLGDAKFTVLSPSPNAKYEELNDYSVVLKMEFGSKKFMFTGDAEELIEQEILDRNADVDVDVLSLGHHGSKTSSSHNFLQATSPEFAIISCAKGNKYNHPHEKVIKRLDFFEIPYYVTQTSGTIILTCDGESININETKSSLDDANK